MGASRDDFTKYPRTPHLFGSRGTDDDKHLGQQESLDVLRVDATGVSGLGEGHRYWAKGIAGRFGYSVRFVAVGPEDEKLGAPTQMAIFERDQTRGE